MRNWILGASLVLMVACSGAENTAGLPKDTVRIGNPSLGTAIVGENYSASLGVLGGVSPYIFTVVDGKLPAGLNLSTGDRGTISGTPTEKGAFTFTVQVTDANLSTKIQKYTLSVTDKPPPEMSFELPGTPVKSSTRIPVVIKNAEKVAGGRFTMSVPEGLVVKNVLPVTGKPLVIWNVKNNILTVDFAFTQKFFRDNKALFLEVESSKEAGVFVPALTSSNYDLRDGASKKLAGTDLLTPAPKPKPADPPASPKTEQPKQEPAKPANTPPAEPTDPEQTPPSGTEAPTGNPTTPETTENPTENPEGTDQTAPGEGETPENPDGSVQETPSPEPGTENPDPSDTEIPENPENPQNPENPEPSDGSQGQP
ncbi:Ig domain-containing protein [Deinococcus misasensis]|uniref:Ig domain-containing protein n=1 Tax=Deinococcus misasensis TaxID=392413 RepID=UPI00068BFD11|nr:Ig domain-containing protein [Deinococcus misasensis]